MPNVQVTARFNESKHEMLIDVTGDGLPPPAAAGTRMALLAKEISALTYNQQQFYGYYRDALDYVRDNNVLNDIAAGDYEAFNHLMVSLTADGSVTAQGVTGNLYTSAPANSISLAIPVQAGWAREGQTIELDNIGKRLYEKFLEDFLKAA